jgi:hypothetical protein
MLLTRQRRHGPCCPDGSPSHRFLPLRPDNQLCSATTTHKLHRLYYPSFRCLRPARRPAETGNPNLGLGHTGIHHIACSPPPYCPGSHIDQVPCCIASYLVGSAIVDQGLKTPRMVGIAMSPSVEMILRGVRDLSHEPSGSTGPSFHVLGWLLSLLYWCSKCVDGGS